MFSSMLKESRHVKNVSWSDVSKLAGSCYNPNDVSQKEFLLMVDKAKKIYKRAGKRRRE
jgi:Ca-activated chloride channel family protein